MVGELVDPMNVDIMPLELTFRMDIAPTSEINTFNEVSTATYRGDINEADVAAPPFPKSS